MSPREQLNSRGIKVATQVWQGRTNPEIALALGTSEQVVKNQLRTAFLTNWVSGAGWN
jgi:DNA-binding NarL/FixJ family response regulator